jgi:hypothetical protein
MNTKSSNKNATKVSLGNIKVCIFCADVCGCDVASHYESKVNLTSSEFVKDKLLCKKHDKQIHKDYKKAKSNGNLVCGREYYKDLVYGVQLSKLRFEGKCAHEDQEILSKRLAAVYADYDSAVLSKENKEL